MLTQAFVAALIAGVIGVVAEHLQVNGVVGLVSLRVSLGGARLGYAALVLAAIAAGLILGLAAGGLDIAVGQSGATVPLVSTYSRRVSPRDPIRSSFSMPYRMIVWPVGIGMLVHAAHWWALTTWHVDITTAAFLSSLIAGGLLVPVSHHL